MKTKEEVIESITDKARADIMHYTSKMANRYEAYIREAYNAGFKKSEEALAQIREEEYQRGFDDAHKISIEECRNEYQRGFSDGQKTPVTSETVSIDSSKYQEGYVYGYENGFDEGYQKGLKDKNVITNEDKFRQVFGREPIGWTLGEEGWVNYPADGWWKEEYKESTKPITNEQKFRKVFGDSEVLKITENLYWWEEEYHENPEKR